VCSHQLRQLRFGYEEAKEYIEMSNIFVQIYRAKDRRARILREVHKNKQRLFRFFRRMKLFSSSKFSTVEWQGLNLLLDKSCTVDRHIIQWDTWEPAQVKKVLEAIKAEPVPARSVFLDVGSYWGLYGLKAHQSGVRDVHFFEPDPRNRAQLYAQLFLNDLQSSVAVHDFAAAGHTGEVFFRRSETIESGNRGAAGLTDTDEGDGFVVNCKPLDTCLSYVNHSLFCKIDVEGAEVAVLTGMKRLISENRIFLQVEVFDRNIPEARGCAAQLGLKFIERIGTDDYYSNLEAN
jgi:FkbM family methyltransferase